jgi:hypothetical protein
MRKLFPVIFLFGIMTACTKHGGGPAAKNENNEPPAIKIISPVTTPELHPGDELNVKARFSDIDLVAVASWEALRAAAVCGNNAYKGEYRPMTYEFEMNFKFIIPYNYAGSRVIRLYGVDGAGNIASADINFRSTD